MMPAVYRYTEYSGSKEKTIVYFFGIPLYGSTSVTAESPARQCGFAAAAPQEAAEDEEEEDFDTFTIMPYA